MQRIVGLCGYARSGKDTAAKGLLSEGWRRVAFADALKSDVMSALVESAKRANLPKTLWPQWRILEDPELKEKFRPLLVEYGRAMRALNPDYWIRRLTHCFVKGHGKFVITDVRYPNEASWIREHGGIVIRIVRPNALAANSEEENSLAAFDPDKIVYNAGTPAQLQEEVLKHAQAHFKSA